MILVSKTTKPEPITLRDVNPGEAFITLDDGDVYILLDQGNLCINNDNSHFVCMQVYPNDGFSQLFLLNKDRSVGPVEALNIEVCVRN